MPNLKFTFVLFILIFSVLVVSSFGQSPVQNSAQELKLNVSIEGQITEGGTQSFALHLESNQIAVFVLEQGDAKLKLGVNDAKSGAKLLDVNFNFDNFGNERVLVKSENSPQDLVINIARFPKDYGKGNFKFTLTELKTADAKDKLRIAAQSTFLEGLTKSSKEAIPIYENALKDARESGDSIIEVQILRFLQNALLSTGENNKSFEYGKAALSLLGNQKSSYEYIYVEANIGFAFANGLGEPKRAVELLSETVIKARKLSDLRLLSYVLTNLSLAHFRLGNSLKALEYAEEANNAAEMIAHTQNQNRALLMISAVHYDQGDFNKAIEILNKSLVIAQNAGNFLNVEAIYNELGRNYFSLGQMQRALDYHQMSLAGKRQYKDTRYNEAISLKNIGNTYANMGQSARALDYNRQAAEIFSSLGNKDATIRSLILAGDIYLSLSNYDKAKESFAEALKISEQSNFRRQSAEIYNYLGSVDKKLNSPESALNYFQKAVQIWQELKTQRLESVSLNFVADIAANTNQLQTAEQSSEKALEIARIVGDRKTESDALYNLARVRRSQNELRTALSLIEDSLKITESLRSALNNQENRTAYFSAVREKYDLYIGLLIELENQPGNEKHGAQAYAVSEKARARNLLDLLAESSTDVSTGINPELKAREQYVQAKISSLQMQLIRAKSAEKPDTQLIARLEKEINRTDDERVQLESEIRRTNPRYAALKYPTTLDLAQTQKMLDDKTVLFEYQTGATASVLFVVGKNDFQVVRLPNEQKLRESIDVLRRSISQPSRAGLANYLVAGRELYQTLLAPAENALKMKSKIIISADGAINYLPFEVLLTEKTNAGFDKLPYLVRNYEISYTPSASVLATLDGAKNVSAAKPQKSFLAFAAPDYGAKSTNQGQLASQNTRSVFGENRTWDLTALPNAAIEADRIAKLFPAGQSTIFSGAEATEEQVKTNEFLSQYRYLHFAVHGLIDEEQPQFSSLVLTLPKTVTENSATDPNSKSKIQNPKSEEDGLLQTPEIFNLRLQADLVTLSACETGLGKEMRGEGIVGLTRAFFYAGTQSVLVSLWKVNDASTADLMTQFYEQLRKNNGKNKAAALRQAQLQMISQNRYAHPYYWAPFILQGKSESTR